MQVIFFPGGNSRVSRPEDKRAVRSASLGYHSVSDSGTNSAGSADNSAVEARLLQAQSAGPHALWEPGEEQPRGQSVHSERQE